MRYFIVFALLIALNAKADVRKFSQSYQICLAKAENPRQISLCSTQEIGVQKKKLTFAYFKLVNDLNADDKNALEGVERKWIAWRDSNYDFLSEHIAGEYVTTRTISLTFMLNAIYDRAQELEMISTALGH